MATPKRATSAQVALRKERVLALHHAGVAPRAMIGILQAEGFATANAQTVKHDRQDLGLQQKKWDTIEQRDAAIARLKERRAALLKWADTPWHKRTKTVTDFAAEYGVSPQAITNDLCRLKRSRCTLRRLNRASEAAHLICVLGRDAASVARTFNVHDDTIRADVRYQFPNWRALRDRARAAWLTAGGGGAPS
ncbi:hypothetical protein [Dyella psychrodurans]|uniref:Uncharacterized protein n=1 Tax=Dyella psychrodurans TaxID=1927960 RepID=A0A370XBN5_9GAMM|nr:hypothetical protein [Dyella psychrodurans]RDS85833.1 hypothetical protein DWU99_00735 [Dyella psychrodurans]